MQLRLRTMRGGAWRVAVGRYVVPVRVRVCVFVCVFVESLWSLCGDLDCLLVRFERLENGGLGGLGGIV